MNKVLTVCAVTMLVLSGSLAAQQQRTVKLKPGFATVIICPQPPDFVTVGNTQQFSVENSGTFILVKPLVNQGSTNMFIKAGVDSFHLILRVADVPDLEVRLGSQEQFASKNPVNGYTPAAPANGNADIDVPVDREQREKQIRELRAVLKRARSILPGYLRKPRPYAYSVKESNVVFAVDYMIQIRDKLFVVCTMKNNSKIPYDIGYVRFKVIDQASSYIFFKKNVKEADLEPVHEVFKERIPAKSVERMLFVFEKQGFSSNSKLEIKCIEASGRRDLALQVPASYVE